MVSIEHVQYFGNPRKRLVARLAILGQYEAISASSSCPSSQPQSQVAISHNADCMGKHACIGYRYNANLICLEQWIILIVYRE